MDSKEIQRLRYRMQYLLVPQKIDCPFQHQLSLVKEDWFLYSHDELPITRLAAGEADLILLGNIFDYEEDFKSNLDILHVLVQYTSDNRTYLESLERYSGSFVLVYTLNGILRIVHDAYASRKIYYSRVRERSWCASQPHLLARLLNIGMSESESKIAFMASPQFQSLNRSGAGSTTCYDGIEQVLPNHYLNLEEGEVKRYWPNEERIPLSVDQVVDRCVPLIKGYVSNIASQHKIMLPLTAGKDSRTLLAATREIKDKVFYYINKSKDSDMSIPDFNLPIKLTKKLNIAYHILDTDIEVDEGFKEVYYENNPNASDEFLPVIYNYYLHFRGSVNLPGLIATGGAMVVSRFQKE